ncbi:hypothetical protein D1007_10171 [Hordeum vulgare]|uniref:Predicted protein n=1 Tax=Hordeum vulgare subsp. vulgare TaxID=112509 RepID=F2DMM7_HORVV|nr:uncharacterized protein LOC123402478 [Hordeum vulgare subsp. vulgare]KAE8812842.1 hypothetical protein D1007_10171 [Hordeum vulgare]KAI4981993.1 hypothetical protein ZWY2020_022485 [Hordeum vulgare]BAJ96348.1 predicted protein [Hordeum vulgare subsp. vulgare]
MDADHDHGGGAADEAEAAFFARRGSRCCCFPCWPSSSSSSALSHQRVGGAGAGAGAATLGAEEEHWWQGAVDAMLKVREWSELAAGPRWKTFIRRFGRGPGPRPHHAFGGRKLNYDALSYALNFDEGHGATPDPGDHAGGYRDFSSRFAAPPSSAKSSMDLGGRDAPPLFRPPPADA